MNTPLLAAAGAALLLLGAGLAAINYIWPTAPDPTKPPGGLSQLQRRFNGAQKRTLVIQLLLGVGIGTAIAALTGWLVSILVVPVVVIAVPRLFSDKAEKSGTQMLVDLEAWTRSLTGMLATGRGLDPVLRASVTNAHGAMAQPVQRLVARLSGGWSTEKALRGFGEDLSDATADLVVMNLIAASRNPGPGLRDALEDLAALVAEDVQKRRTISAERARPRFNARLVFYITCGVVLAVPFIPQFSQGYRTPFGQLLFVIIVGVLALIVWRMQRIVRPVRPPRIIEGSRA